MKHLLSILTAALALTATTASAAYYYDYYLDPPSTPVKDNPNVIPGGYTNQSDSFTYGTLTDSDSGSKIASYSNTFTVGRESNWNNAITYDGNNNNFFRIEVGKENNQKIALYLTDFVSNLYPDGPYNSTSNALFNKGIVEYGYRTLTFDEQTQTYVAGETVTKSILVEDASGKIEGPDGTKYKLNESNVQAVDTVKYFNEPVIRYQYSLGNFNPGDVIELYMMDNMEGEVYSFSSYENGEYIPFDNASAPTVDGDTILTVSQGGFGDGGYRVAPIETDAMLNAYYFDAGNSGTNYHDYTPFDANKTLAAGKAMPLSQLIPTNGTAVSFGIYALATGIAPDDNDGNGNGGAFGAPLPGGVQMALIAGLFGLGFCYVRRRKAIVG